MEDKDRSRKWLWISLAAVALIAVAALAVALVIGTPKPIGDGSTGKPGGSGPSSAAASSSVPASLTATAPSVPSGGRVTMDAGEKAGTFEVRVFLWNDTQTRPLNGMVVKWGTSGKWEVDPVLPAQKATIGPFRTGQALKLLVYPDGENGKSDTVPFLITSAMVSGSDRDVIHIEVRDDGVRVLGNPVSNFERSYPRPRG